ncbi:hypothetical protein FQA39_LY18052 [Lamprigera yunnana]|nr:hypothetical protein FQA39_LY18052 [Lamprigera yunnana]
MKMMFLLFSECAQELTKYLEKQNEPVLELELKELFSLFTSDVIGSVAFGLHYNSFEDKNNEFYLMGKRILDIKGLRMLLFSLYQMLPTFTKVFRLSLFAQSAVNFFYRIVKETITRREEEGFVRIDMIHLLLQARKGNDVQELEDTVDTGFATVEEHKMHYTGRKRNLTLTDEDIAAQALIFFFAGFDMSATLISFTAYELAINSDVQDRLQNEIDNTISNCQGKLTYEALHKMKYMDMVVSASRFALMENKTLIFHLLSKFDIIPIKKTQIPLNFGKGMLNLGPTEGFWLGLRQRKVHNIS